MAEGRNETLLAIFNWKDESASLTWPLPQSLEGVQDAWTGASVAAPRSVSLAPRESLLWRVPKH